MFGRSIPFWIPSYIAMLVNRVNTDQAVLQISFLNTFFGAFKQAIRKSSPDLNVQTSVHIVRVLLKSNKNFHKKVH